MNNSESKTNKNFDKRSNALRENLLKRKQQAKDKKESNNKDKETTH